MITFLFRSLPWFVCLCLVACATTSAITTSPTVSSPLPPVAAQFQSSVVINDHGKHQTTQSQWRLWRDDNRVQRETLTTHTGELWQRDGKTVFHTLLFHDDRRGVEFDPVDLEMLGAQTSWDEHARLISPELLARLTIARSGQSRGIAYIDYVGSIGDTHWKVRMRTDIGLPISVEQRTGIEVRRTDLIEAHTLATAPWQPTPTTGYDMLDFADLGDHERDPFVMRLQASWQLGHDHGH